ncbi:MAG: hypothetical protein ACI9F9_002770 [Candidatus Paceibacteria bacterium]|jgi:hypothetical protein
MSTRAFRTLDCAQTFRVHYYLPRIVAAKILEGMPTSELEIQEFSKLVDGAKNHFRAASGKLWSATGVMGGRKLVVTYGKFGGGDDCSESSIRSVMDALENMGCGPVIEQAERRAG